MKCDNCGKESFPYWELIIGKLHKMFCSKECLRVYVRKLFK